MDSLDQSHVELQIIRPDLTQLQQARLSRTEVVEGQLNVQIDEDFTEVSDHGGTGDGGFVDLQRHLLFGLDLAQLVQRVHQSGLSQLHGMRIDEQVYRIGQSPGNFDPLPPKDAAEFCFEVELRGGGEHLFGGSQSEQPTASQDLVADGRQAAIIDSNDWLVERNDGLVLDQTIKLHDRQCSVTSVFLRRPTLRVKLLLSSHSEDHCGKLNDIPFLESHITVNPLAIHIGSVGAFQVTDPKCVVALKEFGVFLRDTATRQCQRQIAATPDTKWGHPDRYMPNRFGLVHLPGKEPD